MTNVKIVHINHSGDMMSTFWQTFSRNIKRDAIAVMLVGFTLYFVGITAEMHRDVPPNRHLYIHAEKWQTQHHFMHAR